MNFPAFTPGAGGFTQGFTGTTPVTAGKYMEALKRPLSEEESKAELIRSLVPVFKQQAFNMSPEGMERQLEMARKDAFQKGKTGLMFSTLANLPQAFANAVSPYGGPVGSAMAYEGMSRIPGIYSETLRSFPQIQVPASSYSSRSYF